MTLPTSTEPHKYRCETCEYWDKSQFPHKWGCNKIKRWMDYSQVDWIIRVGCASHSDVGKAEQQIADVIEELENSIKTGSEIRLDKLIKKLRGELV